MTLQKIKDDYAKKLGYSNWNDLCEQHVINSRYPHSGLNYHQDKVCILAQKQALKNAAENGKLLIEHSGRSSNKHDYFISENDTFVEVCTESILSESNLVK